MEKSLLLASNPNIDNNIPLYGPLKWHSFMPMKSLHLFTNPAFIAFKHTYTFWNLIGEWSYELSDLGLYYFNNCIYLGSIWNDSL